MSVCFAALLPEHAGSRPETIRGAVVAAREAGFAGLSLFAAHAAAAVEPADTAPPHNLAERIAQLQGEHRRAYDLLLQRRLDPFVEELAEAGLAVRVLEFMTAWTQGEGAADEEARAFSAVARRFGADHILCLCADASVDRQAAVRGLARAADVAEEHGLRVCLEFAPIFALGTFRAARELIEAADRPNLDFALDTFHWAHDPDGPDVKSLAQIPGDRIGLLQVASRQQDTGDLTEAQFARALPSPEDAVLRDLLATLNRMGATPVVAPEVFNTALLEEIGQRAFAKRLAEATRSVL